MRLARAIAIGAVIGTLLAWVAVFEAAAGDGTVTGAELYFYVNGDNDLLATDASVSQGERVFESLSRLAGEAGPGTAFHLYYDSNAAIPGNRIRTTLFRRYRNGALVSEESLEETDSTDPRWVRKLLSERYLSGAGPGTFRALFFWSHGDGWRDLDSYDFSAPASRFNYLDLAAELGGSDLDLVVFDACRMAYLETLAAYRPVTRYLIASQFPLPVEGIAYGALGPALAELRANPADRAAWARLLEQRLNEATLESQKDKGVFAPIALYDLGGLEGFLRVLNPILEDLSSRLGAQDWSTLVNRSRPPRGGLWAGDEEAVDARALAHRIDVAKLAPEGVGAGLVRAYGMLAPGGYGSVQFFLPEELGRIPDSSLRDELLIQSRKPWTEGLAGWRLARRALGLDR
jgi:hypothetical protein